MDNETGILEIMDLGHGKVVFLDGGLFASVVYAPDATSVLLYGAAGAPDIGLDFEDDEIAAEFLSLMIASVLVEDEVESEEIGRLADLLALLGEPFYGTGI